MTTFDDVTLLLDRSGSMVSIREATISGINTFINKQKQNPKNDIFSFITFDSEFDVVMDAVPLAEVPEFTQEHLVPRGFTALLDAIYKTINRTKTRIEAMPQKPDSVTIVIVTDGEENASREVTRDAVFELVKAQQDVEGWNFVYLGANQDAIKTAQSFGVAADTSVNYCANNISVQNAFWGVGSKLLRARSAGTKTEKTSAMWYTHADREIATCSTHIMTDDEEVNNYDSTEVNNYDSTSADIV